MPTLNDELALGTSFSLFKGEPGTRKSTCALSYPTPHFWFSWDKKMNSLLLPMKNFGVSPADVNYEDYNDWSKAEAKLKQLQVTCPYKTVIVDSITSLGDSIMGQTKRMKQGKTRSSGVKAGRLVGGIEVNELEDYNAESSAILDLISILKDVHQYHKVNVILIAHVIQVEYKSPDGETHFSRSIVTAAKKTAAKIPAYCEEVYHFNIDKGFVEGQGGSYALLTEHTGDDFARTGLPLDKKIVFGNDPLYSKFILPAINKLKTQPDKKPLTTF
jgi:hypothetical protein